MSRDQQSAWQAAQEKCAESTGWNATNELSESQRKELYRQEVATHECLTKLGIDSDPPPSEQTYLDTFQQFAFQPGFDQLDTGELNQAILTCPPPTWFMNISGSRTPPGQNDATLGTVAGTSNAARLAAKRLTDHQC